jgi:uncharacterized protein (DUF362 family)
MDRRQFIKGSLALTAALLAGPAASFSSEAKAQVLTAKGKVDEALGRMMAKLGGIEKFISEGDRVLVKPNFSWSDPPAAATTTSPEVVKAVVLLCKDAGAKLVTVFDHTIKQGELCLKRSGIQAALKGIKDVEIVVPDKKADYREVEIQAGESLKKVRVANAYYESDFYLNLPIAKSHSSTTVTFGLKNQMGLIHDRKSFHWRYDLHQAIADLATVVKPDLTVVDATRCLKTGGPGGPGEVVQTGLLLCSTDLVAIDAYATTLVPWGRKQRKPEEIKHIRHAAEHGLGQIDLTQIQVVNC